LLLLGEAIQLELACRLLYTAPLQTAVALGHSGLTNHLSACVLFTVGEAIQLELACEPSNVVAVAVEVQRLALPPKLMPAGGLEGWLRSDSCCLLQLAGSGLVKVRGSVRFVNTQFNTI
jgi:hypothetical protein